MHEYLTAEAHAVQLVSDIRQVARELPPGAGTTPGLAIMRLADEVLRYYETTVHPLVQAERARLEQPAAPQTLSTGPTSASASCSRRRASNGKRKRGGSSGT